MGIRALVGISACICAVLGLSGCSGQKRDGAAVLAITYEPTAFFLCIPNAAEAFTADEALWQIRMCQIRSVPDAVPARLPAGATNAFAAAFPAYTEFYHVALDDRAIQDRFLSDAARSGIPLAYGRAAGQRDGQVGILFVDAGLGPPRPEYTPVAIIVESWDRLHTLLNGHISERLRFPSLILGDDRYAGNYVVEGFRPEDVPEWAREREAAGAQPASR